MARRTPAPPPRLLKLNARETVDISGVPDLSRPADFLIDHLPRNGCVLLMSEPETSKLAIPGAKATSPYLVVLAVAKDVEDLKVGDVVSATANNALVIDDGGPCKRYLIHETSVLSVVTRRAAP